MTAMEYDEAVGLVTRLVCAGRRLDVAQVRTGDDLHEALGFDSLDAAELVAAIHKETGLELDVSSYQELRTVGGIAARLAEGGAQ